MSKSTFSSLKLHPGLLKNLATLKYHEMTPIQALSLPVILQGDDLIAQAKTGSGKTAAFGLGLLNKLRVEQYSVQTLVLCPTRELADQVAKEVRRLARAIHNIKVLTLCGGMPLGPQIGSLAHGAHIIVGTPGRIEEHLRKKTLKLDQVSTFVLDEADRMLDMGFEQTINAIVARLPSKRQSMLFSATYPDQIQKIAKRVMRNPKIVKVENVAAPKNIKQKFYKLPREVSRDHAVQLLLHEICPISCVIFCNTKKECQALSDTLRDDGFRAVALHGDLEQKQRNQTLVRFANRSVSILTATDVAARGLDIDDLDLVINYHIAREPEVHVHRTGRTGRAGKEGMACTLLSHSETYKKERLEEYLDEYFDNTRLPNAIVLENEPVKAPMVTLQIDGGKKQKVRPGDILGALTGENGIAGDQVGKIDIFDETSYFAVTRKSAKAALDKIRNDKIKGREFRVRRI